MPLSTTSFMSRITRVNMVPKDDEELPARNGERKKVVMTTSILTALRHCFFHIIPISTSTAILTINIRGVFIGFDFSGAIKSETINLMLLQLAAKAHEILIVTSLGLVILQTVRHELLFGDGLPLGLVGSGLSFSDFSLFFRREFYASLKYLASHGNRARKVGFIILLVMAILTAALAGPASAVLLVPRSQTWPSAATEIFLNGSTEDFWPSDLSGDLKELSQLCQSENPTSLAVCPAGGFSSLHDHWSRMNSTTFFSQDIPPYARLLSGSYFYWPVHSPNSLVPTLYALGDARVTSALEDKTTLVQPLAASAVILQQTANDWWKAMTEQKKQGRERMDALIDDRQVRAQTQSAIATIRCAAAQKLSAADKAVLFPTIPFWFDYGENSALDIKNLTSTPTDHLQFQWMQLPGSYGPASIGGIFQSPWTADNASRVVIGCTAQTGWVPSDVRTDSYSFWSGWYPWNITYGARTPRYVQAAHDDSLSSTNGRIALGDQWLKMLSPIAPIKGPLTDDWSPSTVESILSSAGLGQTILGNGTHADLAAWTEAELPSQGRIPFLEAILCSVLVDGISRTASHRVFNLQGQIPQWHLNSYQPLPDFSQKILSGKNAFSPPDVPPGQLSSIEMAMSITGFALRRSLSTYLAMSVLLTHGAMALGHIIWILYYRRTSCSWSSVTELLVLAQNSTPAFGALANTAAGIECAGTFARIAKIRVRSQPGSAERNHVELVFEDTDNRADQALKTRPSSRRSSSLHSDPWPLLPLDGNVSDGGRRARAASTWPKDSRMLSVQHEETASHGRSASTERLIPQVHIADHEKGDIVRVNRAYG
jgi:hypothetical protein